MAITYRSEKGLPLTSAEIDANFAEVEAIGEGQFSNALVYSTYALMIATTGVANTSYKVTNDSNTVLNGYYHYSGGWVKDADLANGIVASGNSDAVSGGVVYENNKTQSRYDISRGSVTIQNNVITLGIGIHYFKDATGSQKSYTVPSEEVYTLGHNESLVFNKVSQTFIQKANTSVSMVDDITLLNYDSTAKLGGGLWYKKILDGKIKNNTDLIDALPNNIALKPQAIDYHALYCQSRASISISGNNVTIGTGSIYTLFKDGIQKTISHTETTYNIPSANVLVHNKTTNSLSVKGNTTILEDDAILFWYDVGGGLSAGLLMVKYLKDLINDLPTNVQTTNNHSLTAMSRASISISGNQLTLGSEQIYIVWKDGTQTGTSHTEATYTFSNGEVLVFQRSNSTYVKKSGTTILEDDAILFNYDSVSGGFMSGLLVNKVLDDKINNLVLPTSSPTKNLLTSTVKAIAHRGYSLVAPEDTLPSYKLAKEMGFAYVETDIGWSSDNVPVLIHDSTIDRTSNGTGLVESFTLAELKTYDFGSWKSAEYTGTTIPTFEEFLIYCRQLNLHPYVEPKAGLSGARATILIDIAIKTGMINKMTWISFDINSLNLILASVPTARVGFTMSVLSETVINQAIAIKTSTNDVFIDASWESITTLLAETCLIGGVPLETWTVNNSADVLLLVQKGVSGITTDSLNIEDILNA